MAPRIGFIAIGHPDYPNETGWAFCDEAMDAVAEAVHSVAMARKAG